MLQSHHLPVRAIERLTPDAIMITFGVAPHLHDTYRYRGGQHVTVVAPPSVQASTDAAGNAASPKRSFSICLPSKDFVTDPHAEATLAIGIRVRPDGTFSRWAAEELQVGDFLEVLSPSGRFVPRQSSDEDAHYAAIAAGSGITPIMAIMGDVLAATTSPRFDVVLGNRSAAHVMFADVLQEWHQRWPDRLTVHHYWSQATNPDGRAAARISTSELGAEIARQHASGATEWFLCGPAPLMTQARDLLYGYGVSRRLVHHELFH